MSRRNLCPKRPQSKNRAERLARIAYAESLGFVRCAPYLIIGLKRPRWFKDGGYYDFAELPDPPQHGQWKCPHCGHDESWFDRTLEIRVDSTGQHDAANAAKPMTSRLQGNARQVMPNILLRRDL